MEKKAVGCCVNMTDDCCLWWRIWINVQLIKNFMALIQDTIQICIFQCPFSIHFKGELIFFFGIKLFNHLPVNIKHLSKETKLFKHALKRFFLLLHSFHSIEDYINYNDKYNLCHIVIYITGIIIFICYSYCYTVLFQIILYKLIQMYLWLACMDIWCMINISHKFS
jgi:hypothetical protein